MYFIASVPTTQSSLDQTLAIKKDQPSSFIQTQPSLDQSLAIKKDQPSFIQTTHTTNNTNNNTNMNLLTDVKSMNMMPTNMPSNLNMSNINMANLNINLSQGIAAHMSMHNQLENMINTTASLTNIQQNSHNVTMSQQHSNGFPNTKRGNSPPNMLNNNGIPGLNMGMNIGAISSIFDPIPIVSMPMQLPVKKEEKSIPISQAQLTQKPIDGLCISFACLFFFLFFYFFS